MKLSILAAEWKFKSDPPPSLAAGQTGINRMDRINPAQDSSWQSQNFNLEGRKAA
jgi:hypothetical protein